LRLESHGNSRHAGLSPDDWEKIAQSDVLSIPHMRNAIRKGNSGKVINLTRNGSYETAHQMTPRQVEMMLADSLTNLVRQKRASAYQEIRCVD
jgi:aconitate hydratase